MNGTRVVPSTPIARSASTEHSRYAIAGVQPVVSPHNAKPGDIVGGFLVATNGRMLAVAPANFYDPPAKGVLPIIPSEAIPANVAGITINGKIESDGGTKKKRVRTVHEPVEGTFPPAGAVTKDVVDADTQWIGLSAKLLIDLAVSIGSGEHSQVYLGIKVKMEDPPHDDDVPLAPDAVKIPRLVTNRAIAVIPGGDGLSTDAFGVLMPVNVVDDRESITGRFNRRQEAFLKAWERHEAIAAGKEPAPYVPEPEDEPEDQADEPEPVPMKPVIGTPEIQAPPPPRVEGGSPDAAIALAKKLGIEVVCVTG